MTVNTYYIFNPPFRHLPKAFKDIAWLTWIIQQKLNESYDFYKCYFGKETSIARDRNPGFKFSSHLLCLQSPEILPSFPQPDTAIYSSLVLAAPAPMRAECVVVLQTQSILWKTGLDPTLVQILVTNHLNWWSCHGINTAAYWLLV